MNILLVAINSKYIHSNPAVFSLKACTGAYQPYVSIAEFTINQPAAFLIREIYQRQPAVIAFSCYIWNRTMIGQIIPDLQKILPGTDIWAGGPEVSYCAMETVQQWHLRGVLAGPGEGTFCRLVSAYVDGTASQLPAVMDGSHIPKPAFNEIPFWYPDLLKPDSPSDFEHRILYYESSRGCPFSCSYCLSSIDKAVEFRDTARVCQELDFFLQHKVRQVKFIDRTFNCKKGHALPILQYIASHDNGVTNFHFEMAADLLDEDYFAVFKKLRPGAVQLEIGIQSTCPETIDEIDRQMDIDKTMAVIRRLAALQNIHVHVDLIAGLPFENLPTFQRSFEDVYALRPHQLQLGFLKVLKGSPMETRAPLYRLVYSSLPPYEVLATKWLSYDDVCRLKQIEEMVEVYYNSGQFVHTLSYLCHYFDSPYAMYESLADWYEKHRLTSIQPSRIRRYEILLEFGMAHITAASRTADLRTGNAALAGLPEYGNAALAGLCRPGNTVIQAHAALTEYLIYDLYLREHMKNRPAFAPPQERWKGAIYNLLHQEAQTHAIFPELAGCNYRELTKAIHTEVFLHLFGHPAAVLFSYKKRDPLTNNGTAFIIHGFTP